MLDQDATIYAHCDRSGFITFSAEPDIDGLICLGSGPAAFRDRVIALSRESHSGLPMVPHVPEAANRADALTAVCYFTDIVAGMTPEAANARHDIAGVRVRAMLAGVAA